MIKYQYIFIGFLVILSPIAIVGSFFGATAIFVTSIDTDNIIYSYDYLNNSTQSILMVYPAYTYFANEYNSLTDIGTGNCDDCESYTVTHKELLTTKNIGLSDTGGSLGVIGKEYFVLVTDYYLEHKPVDFLEKFDKVILMRNTYTTDNFRTMILNHTNVVYMFPDALTKQINTNSTFIKTDGDTKIILSYVGDYKPLHPMAFEWADDNRCENWKFIKVSNGYIMNCTPDIAIINNHDMLMALIEIGNNDGNSEKISMEEDCIINTNIYGRHIFMSSTDCFVLKDATNINNGDNNE